MGKRKTTNTATATAKSKRSPPISFFFSTRVAKTEINKSQNEEKIDGILRPSSLHHEDDIHQHRATKKSKPKRVAEDQNYINIVPSFSDEYETHNSTPRYSYRSEKESEILKSGQRWRDSNDSSCIMFDGEDCGLSAEDKTTYRTDLETVLPPALLKKDTEAAIKEYEILRTARSGSQELQSHLSDEVSSSRKWSKGKSSIYVDAFNLALQTVLKDEGHLFDIRELEVFANLTKLSYEAQYLYVRLFLRKSSAWHRINSLKYYSDISDISAAVKTLQRSRNLSLSSIQTVSNSSVTGLDHKENTEDFGSSFTFADSSTEMITTLEEASSLLTLEELKTVSKEAKVSGKNKSELLKALCRTSKCQSGLRWSKLERYGGNSEQHNQSDSETNHSYLLNSTKSHTTPDQHFFAKIMKIIGPCIRLSLPTLKLFERVHLVFYRSTEWTEKSLITMILAQISQRNFPQYIISRSANIFISRSDLLEFEAALQIQSRVDLLLAEMTGDCSDQCEKFDEILTVIDKVYPRWKILIQEEKQVNYNKNIDGNIDSLLSGQSGESAYLRRFSPTWVYTRIVHKGLYVLGRLKQYEREYDLISELLNQSFFHSARRGPWYQRKALLEEHYMYQIRPIPEISDVELQKKYWKRIALHTCETALQDKYCHQIFHYDLQKRICKLEKKIKIPKREKHDFSHVLLYKPTEVWIEGIQIVKDYSHSSCRHSEKRSKSRNTKTIWIDEFEGGGECSVEAMCLSSYRSRGYKGFHSEGGIIQTLFAYLFYDILFVYVPNVFQTAYQTCPLDLFTDAFFPCRASEINHRLVAIENGYAANLIKTVNDKERHKRTCIIGLNWDYDIADLLEAVACFNPKALAIICRVLAQEYRIRRGGMPDLFLWHVVKSEVVFVEVKSANDRLSETQRLWIHVLTAAGLKVELCHAVAKEVRRVAIN